MRSRPAKNSCASRLFPIPGSPKIVTSCARRSRTTRVKTLPSRSSSSSRPTYGAATLIGRPAGRSAQTTRRTSIEPFSPFNDAVAERLDGHAPGREAICRRADQDLAGLRALLEACGDVERLTGGEGRVTRLRDDLAGLDPDPHGQVALARLEDGDGCAHGALGVVLVRDRHAEHGHDRVSGELLHRPAVRRDVRRGTVEERGHAAPDDLRVASGDERGGIDEIDEQRRRELALHGRSLGSGEEAPRGGFPHLAARGRTSSL